MENTTSILSGTDVQSIANLLREKESELNNIYDFICERFEYIPLKFTNKDINEINENPIEANEQFSVDVDGASGDTTIKTPETLLEIYISIWDNILEYKKEPISEHRRGRKPKVSGPHYKYNLSWRKDSNIDGDFSGDVLISFPKFEIPENVSANYIKLFARLVYTIGNFMPAPKLKEGNSLNKIHGHCCYDQGLVRGGYERMDCFLLDIDDNNSKNKENYKSLLGDGYSMENFVKTFHLNCYLKNGKVLDLSFPTLDKTCEDKGDLEILRPENFVNYIINGCACIIARGNRLLEVMKIKKIDK